MSRFENNTVVFCVLEYLMLSKLIYVANQMEWAFG